MGWSWAAATGAVGGVVGAGLMLPLFRGAELMGLLPKAPPRRVIDRVAASLGKGPAARQDDEERTAAAVAAHLLYGGAAGAVYGTIAAKLSAPPPASGVAYGLVLWAAGYLGWLPAAGVLPPPWRQRPGGALTPLVAHAVYGLALGLVTRALRR